MAKKQLTIDDLLASLQNPELYGNEIKKNKLENTIDTWGLIGDRNFEAIAAKTGIEEEEVNDFLKEWVEENPYKDI